MKKIILPILLIIAVGLSALWAGYCCAKPRVTYNSGRRGTIIAINNDSFVIQCDDPNANISPYQVPDYNYESFCCFRVNDSTKIYGRQGSTEVTLNDMETGMYVEVWFPTSQYLLPFFHEGSPDHSVRLDIPASEVRYLIK